MTGSRLGRPAWYPTAPMVLASAALWIGFAGCGTGDSPGAREEGAAIEEPAVEADLDPARARKTLMEADRAFARETAQRGVEGWVSYFAPEGAQVRGSGEITGHAAIREAMAGFLSDTTIALTWEPVRADAAAGGDLGYTVGRYSIRSRAPGGGEGELLEHGMYLTVWKRQPDGSWKIVADTGNPAREESEGASAEG